MVAHNLEDRAEVKNFLDTFPTEILRAKDVMKYYVEDSSYCLIHVRQKHSTDSYDELSKELVKELQESIIHSIEKDYKDSSEKLKALHSAADKLSEYILWQEGKVNLEHGIQLVQEDIIGIVLNLKSECGIQTIYAEGVSPEMEQALNEALPKLTERLKNNLEKLKLIDSKSPDYGQLKEKTIKIRDAIKKIGFHDNAYVKLAATNLIEIRCAETKEANDAGREEEKKKDSGKPYDKNKIYSEREKVLLELVVQHDEPYALTIYGAGHDFRDEIEAWNHKNLDKKFSLIVVTPQTLDDEIF